MARFPWKHGFGKLYVHGQRVLELCDERYCARFHAQVICRYSRSKDRHQLDLAFASRQCTGEAHLCKCVDNALAKHTCESWQCTGEAQPPRRAKTRSLLSGTDLHPTWTLLLVKAKSLWRQPGQQPKQCCLKLQKTRLEQPNARWKFVSPKTLMCLLWRRMVTCSINCFHLAPSLKIGTAVSCFPKEMRDAEIIICAKTKVNFTNNQRRRVIAPPSLRTLKRGLPVGASCLSEVQFALRVSVFQVFIVYAPSCGTIRIEPGLSVVLSSAR